MYKHTISILYKISLLSSFFFWCITLNRFVNSYRRNVSWKTTIDRDKSVISELKRQNSTKLLQPNRWKRKLIQWEERGGGGEINIYFLNFTSISLYTLYLLTLLVRTKSTTVICFLYLRLSWTRCFLKHFFLFFFSSLYPLSLTSAITGWLLCFTCLVCCLVWVSSFCNTILYVLCYPNIPFYIRFIILIFTSYFMVVFSIFSAFSLRFI